MKKNLLTIGDISKKTGCSIKSLRYYDSIGLLKPIYVDPNTNYRYYNFEQTKIVEIIQLCIFLDIPLKDVKELTIKDDNTMDYSNLIEYGRKITKEKIIKLQNNLTFLDTLKKEVERINSYDNNEEKSFHIDEKYYYVLPLFEDEMNDNYYKILDTLFTKALNENILLKHDYGIIMNINDDDINKFVAVEVDKKYCNLENVIKVDSGNFLCKKTNEFNLTKIYEMFSNIMCSEKTIIITSCYSYDFSSPYFEAKCSL
ncbi:MAG: MerR family DNA-binding transcriptional regulator [uncultured Clostridium sp.]